MNVTRREFVKDSLAALGFLALPGGLFAAPAGWKPKGSTNGEGPLGRLRFWSEMLLFY